MNTALWIVQGLVALVYVLSGGVKATQPIDRLAKRMPWMGVVSPELVRFIGIAEIVGALGLILPMVTGIAPGLTIAAAIGLAVIQVLAFIFHLNRSETASLPMNVIFLLLALVIAYGRLAVVPV